MAKYKRLARWNQMKAIAEQVIAGTFQDSAYSKIQSRNCLWYYNPAIVSTPAFARAATRVVKIEDHVFFARK